MQLFDTNQLMGVVDLTYEPVQFLSNTFFPEEQLFDTAGITWDKITGVRKLAPFVSPAVEGRPYRRAGYKSETFSPAYIKPKMALTPGDVIRRLPGEKLMGTLSPQQRRELKIADDIEQMIEIIENRLEWMAAQVLTFGYVDVSGEDYPTVRVDFLRDASLSTALAGGNLWSAGATSNPLANLDTWATQVALKQGGSVTDVVMGANVWAQLSNNTSFLSVYKNFQPIGGALPNLLPTVMDNEQKVYRGMVNQFRLWSYNATYTDDAGATQYFVQPNDVLLIAKQGLAGVQAFGAIMDMESLVPARFFPKMWTQPDPSVVYTMLQSAPLMVPRNANGSFRATVL
jgi:Phage major capsid protein E